MLVASNLMATHPSSVSRTLQGFLSGIGFLAVEYAMPELPNAAPMPATPIGQLAGWGRLYAGLLALRECAGWR